MSKIIDIMDNVSAKKQAHHTDIQDEIAKTYFHVPANKKGKPKINKWKPVLPWLIAALAISLSLATLVFKSSIDIKVRVLGEIPFFASGSGEYGLVEAVDKGIFFIRGGEPNKEMIKNIYFSGDGREFSAAKPDEVVLCNVRGSGWANYTIELKEPVDLNKLDIKYTAKGSRGDEYLTLVIVDSNNRSYRMEKDISSALSKEWQKYTMNFRRVKKAVDISNIAKIKFEFGNLTAGNYPNAVMFLKDIYITKARRLKWL
ncbi:MAG: hypothetical protein A3C51_01920 [Omnitrophica bacterium RIFCSPHIGHO2_02_FULL_46_20]|nr:MAG: hypothetical protein A3C51_01920 [Omnitrophica bacterium RIFCSPHIGHO2_02_FULL_46_20]